MSGGQDKSSSQRPSSRGGDSEDGSVDRASCGKLAASAQKRPASSRQKKPLSREGSRQRGLLAFGTGRSLSASLPPTTTLEGYWGDTLKDELHPEHADDFSCHSARSACSSGYSPTNGRPRPTQWSPLDGSVGLNARTAPHMSGRDSPATGGMGHGHGGRHEARQEARLMQLSSNVADLARPVLKHRMALTFAAKAEGRTLEQVIDALTETALGYEAAA